jgi:hypothetical protein
MSSNAAQDKYSVPKASRCSQEDTSIQHADSTWFEYKKNRRDAKFLRG